MSTEAPAPSWVVFCGDHYHFMDPEEEWVVRGFPGLEQANEYARRFVRASIEHHRQPGMPPGQVLTQWKMFGDYAFVGGDGGWSWRDEAAQFAATPPGSPDEVDYKSLDPRHGSHQT